MSGASTIEFWVCGDDKEPDEAAGAQADLASFSASQELKEASDTVDWFRVKSAKLTKLILKIFAESLCCNILQHCFRIDQRRYSRDLALKSLVMLLL